MLIKFIKNFEETAILKKIFVEETKGHRIWQRNHAIGSPANRGMWSRLAPPTGRRRPKSPSPPTSTRPPSTARIRGADPRRRRDARTRKGPTLPVVCEGCPKKHARSLAYNPATAEQIAAFRKKGPQPGVGDGGYVSFGMSSVFVRLISPFGGRAGRHYFNPRQDMTSKRNQKQDMKFLYSRP